MTIEAPETPPTETLERWGVELQVDLRGCDHDAVSSGDVLDSFLRSLVKAIDMEAWGEPYIGRFGDGELHGWSGTQYIMTSTLGVHLDQRWNRAMVNVFSCKDFNPDVVVAHAIDYFGGAPVLVKMQDRG